MGVIMIRQCRILENDTVPLFAQSVLFPFCSKQRNEKKKTNRTTSNTSIIITSTYQPRPRNPSVSTAWLNPLNIGLDEACLKIGTVLFSLNWWPRAL